MIRNILKKLLLKLYGIKKNIIRRIVFSLIYRIDGRESTSLTLREIFKKYYGVEIGMYTQGGCFSPYNFDKYTTIGRYCSIARTAVAFNRNHPMEFKSTHAYFFNPSLGYCKEDIVEYIPLTIGNDVWIGHNAIIMPNVRNIGDGAVIAAGAVVNKDVLPYSVIVGNPARAVRYRFDNGTIEELLASKWWEKSIEEIKLEIDEYVKPYKNNLRDEIENIKND